MEKNRERKRNKERLGKKRRKRPQRDNIGASIITYTVLGVPDYNYSILQPKNLFLLLRPYSRERRSHRESAFPILILSCSSLAMGTRGTIQVKAHPRSGEGDRERERERAHEVPGNYTCHQDRLHIRLYIEASTEESVVGSIPFAE